MPDGTANKQKRLGRRRIQLLQLYWGRFRRRRSETKCTGEGGGEEGREYSRGKSSKSEAVQRSKQTTNLRVKISSGRVIESENQSSALPSILSPSVFSLSSPVSPFQSYHFTTSPSSLQPHGSPARKIFIFHLVFISNFRAIAFSGLIY